LQVAGAGASNGNVVGLRSVSAQPAALRYTERWGAEVDGLDASAVYLCGDRLIVATQNLTLAFARSSGEVLWTLPSAGASSMLAGRTLLRRLPDGEVRRIAVGALGYASGVSVLPALTRALGDSVWMVRDEAAQTIGKLRLGPAIPDLVRAMQDEYWQVRVKAARSLGLLKSAAGLPALVEALAHPMGNLRKEAAIALGEIADPRAIPALEAVLDDVDPDVRKLARLALTAMAMAAR
jgi:hypothetical protein